MEKLAMEGSSIHEGCGFYLKVRYYVQFWWIIAAMGGKGRR
jgi:hypothetical protein